METKFQNRKRTRMILSDREVVMLTFEESDGKTTLTATALFQNIEDRDGMLDSGMESGATETWNRLADLLENERQTIIN